MAFFLGTAGLEPRISSSTMRINRGSRQANGFSIKRPRVASLNGDSSGINPVMRTLSGRAARPPEIAMPVSYVTMWGLLVLMALGAAGELLTHGSLVGSVRAAYPSDMAQSDALHRCGMMDQQFSRFSAS